MSIDFQMLLGPSKVNIPIKVVEGLCQSGDVQPMPLVFQQPPPPPPPRAPMAPMPLQQMQLPLKYQQQQMQPPPPKVPLYKQLSQQQQLQQLQQPPPPPPRPINSFLAVDQFVWPQFAVGNTMLMLCMHIADNKVSLVKLCELDRTIDAFKSDMAKNLDNEKSLYKKFGFSRKKLMTLEQFKADCIAKDTDTDMKPEFVVYLSKLLKRNICVVSLAPGHLERTDYVSDVLDPWVLIKQDNVKGYMLFTGTQTVSEAIEEELFKGGFFIKLASKKKMELKKLAKIVGNDEFVTKYV